MRIFVTANTFAPNRVGFHQLPIRRRKLDMCGVGREVTAHAPENAANETVITTSEAIARPPALSYTVRERRVLAGPANTCSLKPTYTCLYERIGRRGIKP